MTRLYWHTCGEGDHDLVLLHGWGLNAEVWRYMVKRLTPHFRLHLLDLPGHGRSQGYTGGMSLMEMATEVLIWAPQKAIWLGWSLGGLVASQIALSWPERISALITVASSPCFIAHQGWPGIKPEVLARFQQQLNDNFQHTVERFLALQTLGSYSAHQDARLLRSVVLDQPMPNVKALTGGLDILRTTDLRSVLATCSLPFLRIYGYLDGLVPRKVATLLDEALPHTQSVIMDNAAHAPFISCPDDLAAIIIQFYQRNSLQHSLSKKGNQITFKNTSKSGHPPS